MNQETARDKIIDAGYEDIIIFDNPSYDSALIGVTNFNQAVYDYDLMVEYLIDQEKMTEEEAVDFISYNSSYYVGQEYPLILFRLE